MMSKPGATGLKKLVDSTRYSWWGFQSAWKHEEAFRHEVRLAVIMTPLAFIIGVDHTHSLLLLLSVGLVLLAEIINTALESVVDRIGVEHHPLAGQAKDLGSSAVFLSLMIAGIIWISSIYRFFYGSEGLFS